MAGGWVKDGAVQDQIDASVDEALAKIKKTFKSGESAKFCEECGLDIPKIRREVVPGVQFCITCQALIEEKMSSTSVINRRGSKDSQLR